MSYKQNLAKKKARQKGGKNDARKNHVIQTKSSKKKSRQKGGKNDARKNHVTEMQTH
jgi:hypothetical protein